MFEGKDKIRKGRRVTEGGVGNTPELGLRLRTEHYQGANNSLKDAKEEFDLRRAMNIPKAIPEVLLSTLFWSRSIGGATSGKLCDRLMQLRIGLFYLAPK
ncbi:hypothetical protein PIB30_022669 [Stylosanthes scabra]|uniref:Uncharacterized protein n=1 Tax=Stylosanthes scabra TaxID=79078 RepID=A0ABU6VA54_9FABA|nr:hypothetical protein [Stylosanthes scabra]